MWFGCSYVLEVEYCEQEDHQGDVEGCGEGEEGFAHLGLVFAEVWEVSLWMGLGGVGRTRWDAAGVFYWCGDGGEDCGGGHDAEV